MRCNKCGNEVPDDSRYCVFCGAPLAQSPAAPAPVPEPEPEPAPAEAVSETDAYLEKLRDLVDAGIISQEEYDAKEAQLRPAPEPEPEPEPGPEPEADPEPEPEPEPAKPKLSDEDKANIDKLAALVDAGVLTQDEYAAKVSAMLAEKEVEPQPEPEAEPEDKLTPEEEEYIAKLSALTES